jgi:DNA-binding transcriptional ArsR family regulator
VGRRPLWIDEPAVLLRLKMQYMLNSMNEPALERFIEELGIQFELEGGTPRMVGRVFGWLLVCDPSEQSAAELAERLQASKSSISTATRVLLRMGLIERMRIRGERFDRFSALPRAWDEYLWREDQFSAPRRVLRLGMEALRDEPATRRARLQELDSIYAWWERRISKLREEYLADRRGITGTRTPARAARARRGGS